MSMPAKEQCEKRCYVDMDSAQEMADNRSVATGDNIEAYLCPKCKWPHLKSVTKRQRKDKRYRRKRT